MRTAVKIAKKRGNKTLSNRVSKLEKVAKQVEFKTRNQTTTGTVTQVAGFVLLNALSRGDLPTEREGTVVQVKSIQLGVTYQMQVAGVFTQLRVLIVQDRQPNQATPQFTDIYDNTTMTSFRNLNNRSRFITHMNTVVSMSNSGSQGGYFSWYKRFDTKIQYDSSNAGDITDITTNAFYLILYSTDTADPPSIQHTTRLRFTDK